MMIPEKMTLYKLRNTGLPTARMWYQWMYHWISVENWGKQY